MTVEKSKSPYDDIILPYDATPERKLWVAVIQSAMADLVNPKGKETIVLDDEKIHVMSPEEILSWIETDDFRFICKAVGCRPEAAAEQVRDQYARN